MESAFERGHNAQGLSRTRPATGRVAWASGASIVAMGLAVEALSHNTGSLWWLVAAIGGLLTGAACLFLEPLLIAHRLDVSSDFSSFGALMPLAGVSSLAPQPQGGSTAKRQIPYSLQAVLLQLVLTAVFIGAAARYSHPAQVAVVAAYCTLLFEIAVIDLHYRLVLNVLSFPGIGLGILGSLLLPGIGPLSAIVGGVAGLAGFFVIEIVGRGAMGRGDTKLAGVVGTMRGFPSVVSALLMGIFAGGMIALGLVLTGRGRNSTFAYGPALAIGAILSLLVPWR